MTKPKPRCIDHNGNTIVLPDRPSVFLLRPCPRAWDAEDRRKLAQGVYNAKSAKSMKITLPKAPWEKKECV